MNNWLKLENKTVIITGGASGIGKAVAQEFLNLGSNVVVCDMNPTQPVFDPAPGKLLYVVTNVADRDSVQNMIDTTLEKFGNIDVLVNNAGINIPRLLVDPKDPEGEFELNEPVFSKVVDVNLKGVFLCAQYAARQMVKQGHGVVINMSSESGLEGSEGQSIYAATKNAVNSFTRSWAKELGKLGVRVVGGAPGILEATGLRRRSGQLSEVADLVCYIASERASYIHGVTYNIAGGKTRG
ncbi:MAG: SDR family oxidoreductase [Eubacterium sp.]